MDALEVILTAGGSLVVGVLTTVLGYHLRRERQQASAVVVQQAQDAKDRRDDQDHITLRYRRLVDAANERVNAVQARVDQIDQRYQLEIKAHMERNAALLAENAALRVEKKALEQALSKCEGREVDDAR